MPNSITLQEQKEGRQEAVEQLHQAIESVELFGLAFQDTEWWKVLCDLKKILPATYDID